MGLSQWGAAGLSRQGWNYLQIMGFYYAGASISSILGAELPGGRLSTGLAFAHAASPLAYVPEAPRLTVLPLSAELPGL